MQKLCNTEASLKKAFAYKKKLVILQIAKKVLALVYHCSKIISIFVLDILHELFKVWCDYRSSCPEMLGILKET